MATNILWEGRRANTIGGEGGRDGKYYSLGMLEGKNYHLRYLELFMFKRNLNFFICKSFNKMYFFVELY